MLCDITTSSDTGIVTRLQKVSGFTTRKVVQMNLLISCIQFMFIFIDFSCFKLSMWIYGLEVVDGLVAEISQSAGIGALNLFFSSDWFGITEVADEFDNLETCLLKLAGSFLIH